MTNKAFGFQLVQSKEVFSMVENKKVTFPVQVKMTLAIGEKTQVITYGYNRLGGQKPYVMVEGKAPVGTNRADFLRVLREKNIANFNQVVKELGKIQCFKKDEFVVAKCACGGYVTAANVDFIQRNHAALSEKLGKEVTEFSRLCYKCQGHEGPKPPSPKQEKPAPIPAEAKDILCVHCGKKITSQKVVEYSIKEFGKPLCYKPCQSKHKKIEEKEPVQSAGSTESKEEEAQDNPGFSLSLEVLHEIMALEVDPYSAIAKLQEELRTQYVENRKQEYLLWTMTHEEHVRSASEASAIIGEPASEASKVNPLDYCVICMHALPPVDKWNFDICPLCVIDHNPEELSIPVRVIEEAHQFVEPASEASGSPKDEESGMVAGASDSEPRSQDAVKGKGVVNQEDTKEVPPMEQPKETNHTSQNPAEPSNGSHIDLEENRLSQFLLESANDFQDRDVPPKSDGLPF